MNCKNQYLKIVLSIAGLSAVPIAIFTLTSCDGSNVKSLVEAQPTPAGLYREYLSETRGQKELSFEDLTAYIGKWQTLKDSVTATMRRPPAERPFTANFSRLVYFSAIRCRAQAIKSVKVFFLCSHLPWSYQCRPISLPPRM